MLKLAIFKFNEGSFDQGFSITLSIIENGNPLPGIFGRLPQAPEILSQYELWQSYYRALGKQIRLEARPSQVTNFSQYKDCEQESQQLVDLLNQWLRSDLFRSIWDGWLINVKPEEEVRVLLETDHLYLQRLPWHLCDLFKKYTKTEIAISAADYRCPTSLIQQKVRLLIIIGNSEGIDTQPDLESLHQLSGVELTSLIQPTRKQLNEQFWQQNWDILYFAGHSHSENNGEISWILINDTERLTIEDLKFALKQAVEKGLKLAIFNSCDGLGLARSLANLHIPQVIVMRESVPDHVSQTFLRYFLEKFSRGTSFFLAVRQARERLQGLESQFPCATWLPIIYQNPSAPDFIWPSRIQIKQSKFSNRLKWASLAAGILSIISIFSLIPRHSQITSALKTPLPDFPQRLYSTCDKVLTWVTSAPKQAGTADFAAGNYVQATQNFEASLKLNRNDPEALICLNNARIGQRQSYLIAVLVPITGANPKNSLEMLRGFAQAQNAVNQAGGINGIPLKLMIINDQDNPETAKQAAEFLITKPEVLAVTGHWTSDVSLAAAPIYDRGKVTFITPISTTIKLANFSPYVFRSNINTYKGATRLADYMLNQLKRKKVAVFYLPKVTYSEEIRSQFSKTVSEQGGQVVAEFDLSDPGFSVSDSVAESISKGAQVLLVLPSNTYVDKGLQVIQVNNRRIAVLGDLANLYSIRTLEVCGEACSEMTMVVAWHPKLDPNSEFARQSQMLWDGQVNSFTATSYNAVQALIEALKRSPKRADIQKSLSSPDFYAVGAFGPVRFLASGDVNSPAQLVRIKCSSGTNTCTFLPLSSEN